MRSGISSIISVVLLLMILIAMAGAFFLFSSRTLVDTQSDIDTNLNKTSGAAMRCLKYESASGNDIYVRNCGSSPINGSMLGIYIDGTEMTFSIPSIINPNEVGTLTITSPLSAGDHSIKISGGGMDINENALIGGGSATTTTSSSPTTTISTTTIASTTTTVSGTTTTITTTTISSTTTSILTTTTFPMNGLAGYWRFDEGAGNTTSDSSGNGNTANLRGGALKFDGIDDFVNIVNSSAMNDTNSITIMAWINPSRVSGTQDIVCKGYQSTYTGFEFQLSNTELAFRVNPNSTDYKYNTSSGAGITAGVWQFVTVTYNNTMVSFYKNGALISSAQTNGTIYNTADSLKVGAYTSMATFFFNGSMDEVRIYNRSLTAAEIAQNYQGNYSNVTGLVFYMPFMNRSGSFSTDLSGKGNHGLLMNFSNTASGAGDVGISGWTVFGRPFWTTNGMYGNALAFNGADDYVDALNGSSLQVSGNISLIASMRSSYSGWNLVASKQIYNVDGFYFGTAGGGQLYLYIFGNGTLRAQPSSTVITNGIWHRVAAVYDGNRTLYYVDGVNVSTVDWGSYLAVGNAPTQRFMIGGPGTPFKGFLDDLRIYNRSLSSSEIG